jgi:hypothetical protein
MVELKAVDAGPRLQTRGLEAAINGTSCPSFQLHVSEPLQGGGHTHVFGGSFSNRLFDLMTHGGQVQLLQFLFEGGHYVPFRS